MSPELRERLLASIEADRLVIFCGAGLSMAAPSRLPSAAELTTICADEYEGSTGNRIPDANRAELDKLAEYFFERDELYSTFISRLLPRRRFMRSPNSGHVTTAEFLSNGTVECVISTNCDHLVEEASKTIGEPNYQADIDGSEANINRGRKPHLKIHGCLDRDDRNTLWCKHQLKGDALKARHEEFKAWLKANLQERDLIFVGFWTDWAYLNSIFEDVVGGIDRGMVVIVNRSDEATLELKAPALWAWSGGANVRRFVVNESADTFLSELRVLVGKAFVERLHRDSFHTFRELTRRQANQPPTLPATLSGEDLYNLRLDICGVPSGEVARNKRPDASMRVLGAVQIGLLSRGAQIEGTHFIVDGRRVRVIYGQGRILSEIKNDYREEPIVFESAEVMICVGAKDDGGVPSDIVRASDVEPTIVRPAPAVEWITEDAAREMWARGGTDAVDAAH